MSEPRPDRAHFEPLDDQAGPARPLSSAAARAQADALLARHRRPAPRRRSVHIVLAAALLFVTLGALAAVLERVWAPARSAPAAVPVTVTRAPPETEIEVLRENGPAPSDTPPAVAASDPGGPPTPAPGRVNARGEADALHSRDWLELANAARARRDFVHAEQLYLRVVQLHPGSDDAAAARLSAAELRSQQLGRPADAIPLYRAVLNARQNHALAEQARAGLARSHGALGQREQERAAWEELMRYHPDSWFADEARTRLHSLESPGGASY